MRRAREEVGIVYRSLDASLWTDAWFGELPPHSKLVFVYCITSSRQTAPGVFEASIRQIAYEVGLTLKQVEAAFADLMPKVVWWREHNRVWVRNFFRYQRANSNPTNFTTAARKAVATHPDEVQQAVIEVYPELAPEEMGGVSHPHPISMPSPSHGVTVNRKQVTVNSKQLAETVNSTETETETEENPTFKSPPFNLLSPAKNFSSQGGGGNGEGDEELLDEVIPNSQSLTTSPVELTTTPSPSSAPPPPFGRAAGPPEDWDEDADDVEPMSPEEEARYLAEAEKGDWFDMLWQQFPEQVRPDGGRTKGDRAKAREAFMKIPRQEYEAVEKAIYYYKMFRIGGKARDMDMEEFLKEWREWAAVTMETQEGWIEEEVAHA